MGEFVKVGKLEDFREGRGMPVKLDGKRVAIFNDGGELRAIQDACPHMGACLSDGKIEDGAVICHMHGWKFDLKTGEGDHGKRSGLRGRIYEVKVEGRDVYLRRPDEPPRPKEEEWVAWDPKFLKSDSDGDSEA